MHIDNRVTGETRFVGLIGNPVEHSISPQLHNTISSCLGVDLIYIPFKVEEAGLKDAVNGLKALNIKGFNVTTPYKKDIMKYIDENSKEALLMGAVNTVKNIDGRLYGYNTDAEGFSRAFKEEVGEGFKGKKIAIIGAGGAARAITVKIAIEGAAEISIINRTLQKAHDIAGIIENNYSMNVGCFGTDEGAAGDALRQADIIINTTSIGMYPNTNESPLKKGIKLSDSQIVYDIIYNPSVTKLLAGAQRYGAKAVNGLGMLFYQGIYAYEIWTGIKIPKDALKHINESFVNILKNKGFKS
ncbi:shikimate dehydrogenase [Anaerobacterium chartisolvens]|uniref:Shikimate dehydrogenase (NADP(+)) n=1 Tax=Anaerobacterium chartisolvens TaxID=1297424 RepID=A0A369AM97_9FIRM|nr:shikimate dehydrogenase [Anaerobacterium chartisolvens]RCX09297.1 shikimate dehydrogenase [Anaerobacterium chartisolvens]